MECSTSLALGALLRLERVTAAIVTDALASNDDEDQRKAPDAWWADAAVAARRQLCKAAADLASEDSTESVVVGLDAMLRLLLDALARSRHAREAQYCLPCMQARLTLVPADASGRARPHVGRSDCEDRLEPAVLDILYHLLDHPHPAVCALVCEYVRPTMRLSTGWRCCCRR